VGGELLTAQADLFLADARGFAIDLSGGHVGRTDTQG